MKNAPRDAADVAPSIIPAPQMLDPYVQQTSTIVVNDYTHDGTLVVEESDPSRPDVLAIKQSNSSSFDNRGEIFSLYSNGNAYLLDSNRVGLTNTGLLAARATGGLAETILIRNGGWVVNEANGRILAEGLEAVALRFSRGTFAPGSGGSSEVNVDNAGLIEAASLDPQIGSVALWLGHLTVETMRVVNSGTIRADYAILGDSISTATTAQMPRDYVTNLAGGLIDGIVSLDRGNDEVRNAGTIIGDVLMGEGEDLVDTTAGSVSGIIDLGWGNDVFLGSAGADRVGGDNGADRLEGNEGADLLLGGNGDDVLIGGAGNDGLFGERGSDRIVVQGGDIASGGHDDDRIELTDYGFAEVWGDQGFDTLVLPQGARELDLSAILAQERVFGVEAIELGGGKRIAVRPGDIPLITNGGSQLQISGTADDTIYLVGSWALAGSQSLNGVEYNRYVLGSRSVLVEQAAAVSITNVSPFGPLGLDPVTGGASAPRPGSAMGLNYTPDDFFLEAYELTQSVTVGEHERWWNDGLAPVLSIVNTGIVLTNLGVISSESYWNFPVVTGVSGRNLEELVNEGEITATWLWEDDYTPSGEATAGFARAVHDGYRLTNHGLVEAFVLHGTATGVLFTDAVYNHGEIRAYSENGYAVGVNEPGLFENSGSIVVEGRLGAVGVHIRSSGLKVNEGWIGATAGEGAQSIGVQYSVHFEGEFENRGTIIADIAFQLQQNAYSGNDPISVKNTGVMVGRIELGAAADVFDGRDGEQSGLISGGEGPNEAD